LAGITAILLQATFIFRMGYATTEAPPKPEASGERCGRVISEISLRQTTIASFSCRNRIFFKLQPSSVARQIERGLFEESHAIYPGSFESTDQTGIWT